MYERIIISKFQLNKTESITCKFKMDFMKSFCWRSNLSNDDIIS